MCVVSMCVCYMHGGCIKCVFFVWVVYTCGVYVEYRCVGVVYKYVICSICVGPVYGVCVCVCMVCVVCVVYVV